MLAMPEFIARFLVSLVGEALVASIGTALKRLWEVLPRPVRILIQILFHLLLIATFLITFLACLLYVAKAESVWVRIGAGFLGAFCFCVLASEARKAFAVMSDVSKQ
jgi:hypothetical protein